MTIRSTRSARSAGTDSRLAAVLPALLAGTALLACTAPDYRSVPAADLGDALAGPPPPEVSLLLTSDLHAPSLQRWRVLGAMADDNRREPADALLAVGDTVYDCGPDVTLLGAGACTFAPDHNTTLPAAGLPADPRLARTSAVLAEVAEAARPATPVFVALGNHDVMSREGCQVPGLDPEAVSREKACLEVAWRAAGWSMPGRHYAVDAGPVRVIVVDGNVLKNGTYGGFTMADEEAFVRDAARPCAERLCFLASHFPPATTGPTRRREPPDFLARVARIEAAAGPFQAWLTGHHHDLQHLRTPRGRDVFVFGNSSAGKNYPREEVSPAGAELLFHSTRWGFARLEAAGDRWWLRFEGVSGAPLYCCDGARGRACRTVPCPASPPERGPRQVVRATTAPGGAPVALEERGTAIGPGASP